MCRPDTTYYPHETEWIVQRAKQDNQKRTASFTKSATANYILSSSEKLPVRAVLSQQERDRQNAGQQDYDLCCPAFSEEILWLV